MNASTPSNPPTLDGAAAAMQRLATRVSAEISRNPLAGVAACVGAGYLAGKLPLFRFAAGVVRVALPLAPPFLAVVGATRIWDLVAPPETPSSVSAKEEGEALNRLLELTLSAKESYGRLASRFAGEDRRVIDHLRAVHQETIRQLNHAARTAGVSPLPAAPSSDGLAVEQLVGKGGRLAELPVFPMMLTTEEDGVRAFENALLDPAIGESNKTLIRRHLLPRAHENVNSLLRCKAQAPEAALVM